MRKVRLEKILELINEYPISTQEELCAKLREEGYDVTQATVSRDIRGLNLYKVSDGRGGMKYTVGEANEQGGNLYLGALKTGLLSASYASRIVVLKTVSGMAMAVAAAVDNMQIEGVAGCVAGDDTVFVALSEEADKDRVLEDIKNYNL